MWVPEAEPIPQACPVMRISGLHRVGYFAQEKEALCVLRDEGH